MIVGSQKPIDEIWNMVKDKKKVLVFGCNTCVAICHAGGEKEAETIASLLRMKASQEGKQMEISHMGVMRHCEPEYFDPVISDVTKYDMVVSTACGVGVNFLSDRTGAAALGLKNCLCLAGDHQKFSAAGKLKGHPGAKNVYDLDTCQLVGMLKKMRDESKQEGGDPLEVAPKFFIGASWTPMGDPIDFRPINLMKKVNAGADFIQTQGIYDMELFRKQMEKIRNMGLHEKTAILAGIIVPKSAMMLKYMDSSVAGVSVPKEMIDRMNKAKAAAGEDKKKMRELQEQEGIKITIELIHQALETPGVKGVHIQAIEWESAIEGIVKAAGLYPRPAV